MKPFCALECGSRKRFTALPRHDSQRGARLFFATGQTRASQDWWKRDFARCFGRRWRRARCERMECLVPYRLAAVQQNPLIFTFPWEEKKKRSTFSLQHVDCDSAQVENGDMPSIRVRKGYFTGRGDGILGWGGRMFQTPRQAAPACRELEDSSEGKARLRLVRGCGFTARLRLPSASG